MVEGWYNSVDSSVYTLQHDVRGGWGGVGWGGVIGHVLSHHDKENMTDRQIEPSETPSIISAPRTLMIDSMPRSLITSPFHKAFNCWNDPTGCRGALSSVPRLVQRLEIARRNQSKTLRGDNKNRKEVDKLANRW